MDYTEDSENDVTEGNTEAETRVLKNAKRRFKIAAKKFAEWRDQAEEDYDFLAGEQWSTEDLAILEEDDRPAITFNRIEPIIDAVAGLEVNNRQETRYIPRELGDVGLNELLTEAGKWVRDNCDAEDEESEAFLDALSCGMGWTETRMDYDENPDGDIIIERRDPLFMIWDPSAMKQNLSDMRWVMHIKAISEDEFEDMFDMDPDELKGKGPWDSEDWGVTEGDELHDSSLAPFYIFDQADNDSIDDRKIRVVHYQWKERSTYYRVHDSQSNQTVRFSKKKFEKAMPMIEKRGYDWVEQKGWVYKQAFIVGSTVVEMGEAPCEHGFSFKCITGKRNRNDNSWYGLIRTMKDPNRWSNKFFSEILEIIQTGSKGGLMVEEGAVPNIRKLENQWADPRSVVSFNDGALTGKKIQERQQAQYPQGLDRLMMFAIDSIPQVTGINMELLGLAGKVQPGILEAQRKQAGLTILARLFNSLRRYRKEQGRILLYFIQEYISDGRLVRVAGEQGAQYVQLVRDQSIAEYDVVVDDAPTAPNQKERVWAILQEMMPMLQAIGFPAELFDYLPLPESLAQAWKQKMYPQPKTPQEQAEAQRKAELQKRSEEAAVEEVESKATLNYAKANEAASKSAEKVIPIPKPESGGQQ